MSNLYIPKKLKVGFQNRTDTFNGKLAYVIYYGPKGELRKEKSWEGWRDKKIEPIELDNEPTEGFVFNKAISRYNWSHFSSNRSYIRIYDPRGIEFEITPENLIGILMNDNCNKRQLDSKYVYAFDGKDLVLLPCASEEYQKSVEYTNLQSQKVSAKTLIEGCSYKTKKDGDVIYLGRFMWYEWKGYYTKEGSRLGKKYHIFTSDNGDTWITKSSVDFLAAINSEEPVKNYANLIEKFQKNIHSSKIVKFEVEEGIDFTLIPKQYYQGQKGPKYPNLFLLQNGILSSHTLVNIEKFEYDDAKKGHHVQKGFYVSKAGNRLDIENQKFLDRDSYYYASSYNSFVKDARYNQIELVESEDFWRKFGFGQLYVTLENGKRIKVDKFYDL